MSTSSNTIERTGVTSVGSAYASAPASQRERYPRTPAPAPRTSERREGYHPRSPLTLSPSKGERALAAAPRSMYRPLVMAFWVYILQCADGSYYVGHSDNLEDRLLTF